MMIGLLAILKSGGAYVPIDPDDPLERVNYVIEDSGATILLTSRRIRELRGPAHLGDSIICLDGDLGAWEFHSEVNIECDSIPLTSSNLAYVMYTSGSTGIPKGVMVEHRHVSNQLEWMQAEYMLGCKDVVLQKVPFSFDLSVWEIWWPLFAGATIVIAKPGGQKDPKYLCELIRKSNVTVAHFVPSMLGALLDSTAAADCPSVRQVFSIGEELTSTLVHKLHQTLPHTTLHNLYGPTETTVAVTACTITSETVPDRIPIGKPVANNWIHILDPEGKKVREGEAGEIYISGDQVARGYINRPELTKEKFLDCIPGISPNLRAYRTGDLGKMLPDGNIEFCGRVDHQIKVRGFRVELGEIETWLAAHPAICNAAVISSLSPLGDRFLAAYYTRDQSVSESLTVRELRIYLSRHLPSYMLPEYIIEMDTIPLTPNGKLDRNALLLLSQSLHSQPPSVESAARAGSDADDLERQLCTMWQSVLALPAIEIDIPFLDLGGDSLKAIRLINRVGASLEVEVPLTWLFSEDASIRNLAELIRDLRQLEQ
jgi:amino acid adenylation domain-containing protein